ncbi:MAG: hypothetical protein AABY07_02905, partial [Nanoarchaeota archaeon]
AGFDVGKKRHPSHLTVFKISRGRIIQIHQSFLDGWSYTEQIQYLNKAVDNFAIDKGYVDNTRGELEERGLSETWIPLTFTSRAKRSMAQVFEEYIHSNRLELIQNERQRSQILSVDKELKAPATPLGHGEPFFSIGLGLKAIYEEESSGAMDTGDLGEVAKAHGEVRSKSIITNKETVYNSNIPSDTDKCPECGEKAGWIPGRQKCLICYAKSIALTTISEQQRKVNFPE